MSVRIEDNWNPPKESTGRKRKNDNINALLDSAMIKDGRQRVVTFETVEDAKAASSRVGGRADSEDWEKKRRGVELGITYVGE